MGLDHIGYRYTERGILTTYAMWFRWGWEICLYGCSFADYGSGGTFIVKADGKDWETGNETGSLISNKRENMRRCWYRVGI